jgi:hypothetical protein
MHPRIEELTHYLEKERAGLRAAVDSVPADRHATSPAPGRWSVLGVLEHLALLEPRVTGLFHKKTSEARAAGIGPETETGSLIGEFKLHRYLNRELKIDAPDPLQPRVIRELPTVWAALEDNRAKLLAVISDADGLALREITHAHPTFGALDLYHWIGLVGAHEARHADQIREIGASLDGVA